jgi:hypothetical protein
MQSHTTSLEVSKELKEAGWKKETKCSWTDAYRVDGNFDLVNISFLKCSGKNVYPALLSDEILEELPQGVYKESSYYLVIHPTLTGWTVEYRYRIFTDEVLCCLEDKSLPDALAKMWLYLKKENLLGKEV